jgi:hypothetical protein
MVPMTDPVLATDGFTYERSAIEQWLRDHTTSPMTRQPMRANTLTPNRNLKDSIARWMAGETKTEKTKSSVKTTSVSGRAKTPTPKTKSKSTKSASPSAPLLDFTYQNDYEIAIAIAQSEQIESSQATQMQKSKTPLLQAHTQTQAQGYTQTQAQVHTPPLRMYIDENAMTPEQKKKCMVFLCTFLIFTLFIIFMVHFVNWYR